MKIKLPIAKNHLDADEVVYKNINIEFGYLALRWNNKDNEELQSIIPNTKK